ncbi:SusD-like starch-binding protein associating with outer membrane [Dyadobacter jejuensis]|uniref:SusD-like starch-binding protein associating with outer membrane n=1 Tax=Dyadobacter jejuensis TaxID=1082580 RepID=A0A316ARY4_9BACT|nr:RagB/SusD family nutrient uptake outer membrane protein [Dyadobacter jejuensis]PWJ60455.1 SusD-like starch-binding protein associating with outer membrane [Dyadobacter jejuensis]
MKRLLSILLIWTALLLSSCELGLEPYNGKEAQTLFNTVEGVQDATTGNYSLLKTLEYATFYHFLTEYASDNVTLSGSTGNTFFFAYNYRHIVDMTQTSGFWRCAYELIYGANKVIENVSPETSPALDQLLGENLFLRAMAHFDLVNTFGRPYTQNDGAGLGVMIRKDTDVKTLPPRSTVKEVYDFIIADLLQAASLMSVSKSNSYASKEVAYALLSRVYLFKGENAKAVEYANKVIDSGRYNLADTETFKKYYSQSNESSETIFAIKHTPVDDLGKGSIGSMYDGTGGLGWGEMYVSQSYRDLIGQHPSDVRSTFFAPFYIKDASGKLVLANRNGIPKYFIYKYSGQDGIQTLSSPIYLRLADIYLIRAEALAKLDRDVEALADVNRIRTRAGLSESAHYSPANMQGKATALEAVLEERHLELAFECQRKFDLFRNNLPLVRNYPGYHLLSGQNSQVIEPTDPRVVYFIPQQELILNPNLEQNP